jgi:hypothetical protein
MTQKPKRFRKEVKYGNDEFELALLLGSLMGTVFGVLGGAAIYRDFWFGFLLAAVTPAVLLFFTFLTREVTFVEIKEESK